MGAQPDQTLPLLRDEAAAAGRRLQAAWPWLAEALQGGTVTVVERIRDPRHAERELADHYRDRAAARRSIKAGIVPSGPHAAAARIAAADARQDISTSIRDLAERVWNTLYDEFLVLPITERHLSTRCPRCAGYGWIPGDQPEPQDLPDWRPPECSVCRSTSLPCPCGESQPPPPVTCGQCRGHGHIPTGAVCGVCRSTDPCRCDQADALLTMSLLVLLDVLPRIPDAGLVGDVLKTLDWADHRARAVAGVGEDRRLIKAPCPACGRRGDLVAEVSDPDPGNWVARCDSPLCLCTGGGCGCQRPVRKVGRRHLWPAGEWAALAELLGVTVSALTDLAQEPGVAVDGEVYVTAAEACERLEPKVTPAVLRTWLHRRLVTKVCDQAGDPVRVPSPTGPQNVYRWAELVAANARRRTAA